MNYRKKLVMVGVGLLVLLASPLTPFIPVQTASAAPTLNWVDAQTVSDGSNSYIYSKTVSHQVCGGGRVRTCSDIFTAVYVASAHPDVTCQMPQSGEQSNGVKNADLNFGGASFLMFPLGGSDPGPPKGQFPSGEGTFVTVSNPANPTADSSCGTKSEKVNIGSTENASILYDWIDSRTIVALPAAGGMGFQNADTANPTNYYSNVSTCHSWIAVKADKKSGDFYDSRDSAADGYNQQGNCYVKNTGPVALGMVANATGTGEIGKLPPGTTNTNCTTGSTTDGVCENDSDNGLVCASGALDWIVCPVIKVAQSATQALDNFIMGQLNVDATKIFDNTSDPNNASHGYYTAWNSFRVMATALILIVGLVMVISQALGLEILDAYTIRKTLPRLLIAIIGISLSWPLMKFVVVLFDTIGFDVRALIYGPFDNIKAYISSGSAVFTQVIAPVGALLVMGPAALTLILTALLGIFMGFLVLVVRQIIIIILVIVAPVAIACAILPNTQKVWKLWSDNFLGMMLAFPLISAFIAAGHVFAIISIKSGSGMVAQVIGMAAYVAPYFMLLIILRVSIGLVSTLAGFANDRSRGAFDRLKKTRQNAMAQRGARAARYATQQRAGVYRGLQARSNSAGWLGKRAMRLGARAVGGYNIEAMASAQQAATSKELGDQIATGNDSNIRGLTVNMKAIKAMGDTEAQRQGLLEIGADGSRKYKSLGGAMIDEASVLEGQKRWGNNHFAQQAAASYEMRKAMTSDQVADVSNRYASLARDQWGMSQTEASGAWIGAAFENQNQHLEFKKTKIDLSAPTAAGGRGGNSLDGGGLLEETYEKKGSYPLSQMSAHTIEQLSNAHEVAKNNHAAALATLADSSATPEAKRAATVQRDKAERQINQARGIAETFMREMSTGGGARDEEGKPLTAAEAAAGGRRQAGASGAAAVNEAAYQFAKNTGVYDRAPAEPPTPGPPDRANPGGAQV